MPSLRSVSSRELSSLAHASSPPSLTRAAFPCHDNRQSAAASRQRTHMPRTKGVSRHRAQRPYPLSPLRSSDLPAVRFVLRFGALWLSGFLLRVLAPLAERLWERYTQILLEELTTHFFVV